MAEIGLILWSYAWKRACERRVHVVKIGISFANALLHRNWKPLNCIWILTLFAETIFESRTVWFGLHTGPKRIDKNPTMWNCLYKICGWCMERNRCVCACVSAPTIPIKSKIVNCCVSRMPAICQWFDTQQLWKSRVWAKSKGKNAETHVPFRSL